MKQVGMFDTYDKALSTLMARFPAGKEKEQALVAEIARTVIVDRLVPVSQMMFNVRDDGELTLSYSGERHVRVHAHAMGQLCDKATLPRKFAGSLLTPPRPEEKLKRLYLLANNLNELLTMQEFEDRTGTPTRFLHRIVGDELRGFVSRRYNRFLASLPLLKAFRDACDAADARPIEAINSPVRSSLKCLLPKVFEAFPGEHVAIGVMWSNSDFGAGTLTVSQTIWRAKTATSTVLDEALSRVHLGSVIQDSDLELSEDTMHKEVAAQCGAVRDAVESQLAENTIARVLLIIRKAHEEQIPWTKVAARLRGVLNKSELTWLQELVDKGDTIIDLPPVSYTPEQERVPNAYFIASALSHLAMKSKDPDKQMALEAEAGKFLADVAAKAEA